MAILAETGDQVDPSTLQHKPEPKTAKSSSSTPASSSPNPNANPNPFTFWFYFTTSVSLLTLFFVLFSSFTTPQDPKSRFLSMPTTLRTHYSKGRTIKVQVNPSQSPIEVFTYSQGPRGSESVFIVHGLGCSSFTFREVVDFLASTGVFAVAIDLPGSGFSDKAVVEERERLGGVLGRFIDVYDDIKEKGLLWGFDNLIEHGYVPFEEESVKVRGSTRKSLVPLEFDTEELGRVLGQVVDSLGLAPLHLVLHDSALAMSANWVLEKAGSIRSVTLIDTMPRGAALPIWTFKIPVVREVVLGFGFAFRRLIESCCSKSIGSLDLEAYRSVLKSSDATHAIVGMEKKLNISFDLAEWANSDGLKGVPVQVVWSGGWSKEWIENGRQVAEEIPGARLAAHSGGRWPQGDASYEIAQEIVSFIALIPKTSKQIEEETKFDETERNNQHDHHHHHPYHDHGMQDYTDHHEQGSYMDAYGLGQVWEM